MKPLLLLLWLVMLLRSCAVAGELSIWQGPSSPEAEATELSDPDGRKYRLGKKLLTLEAPAAVDLVHRRGLSVEGRIERFSVSNRRRYVIPLSKEQLAQLAAVLPQDQTTLLAVEIDNIAFGFTPWTRDWKKWGCTVSQPPLFPKDVARWLRTVNLQEKDKISPKSPDFAGEEELPYEGGPIEDLILRGKADNPLQTAINLPHKAVFCREPVQAALSLKNIGIDQSSFRVFLMDPGELASNVRAVTGKVFAADPRHKVPDLGGERNRVEEGKTTTLEANLTRKLGCEYAQPGIGPVALQYRLAVYPTHTYGGNHNPSAWLDLPAPEVTVVALEETKFTELKSAAVTGAYDTVRLGTHPLAGKEVTLAVYSRAGKTGRILRLDPNADGKSWELAWDGKAQQLHILQHGTRARYWMSAADQLGWEVRMDVPDYSKLESADGKVRRTE